MKEYFIVEKELTLKYLIKGEIKKFSQKELAIRIGVSNTSLNDFENGKVRNHNLEILRKIVEELDLSLDQLSKATRYNALTKWLSTNKLKKY